MKRCKVCNEEKTLSGFYKHPGTADRLDPRCIACTKIRKAKWRAEHKEHIRQWSARYATESSEERVARRATQKQEAIDRRKLNQAIWRINNKGKVAKWSRDWTQRNPEKRCEYAKRWAKLNPEKRRKIDAKRDRSKKRAKDRRYFKRHRERLRPSRLADVNKRRAIKINAMVQWADLAAVKEIYLQARKAAAMTEFPCHVDHIVPLRNPNVCGLHWEGNLRILAGETNLSKGNKFDPDQDFVPPEVRNDLASRNFIA